MVNIDQSYLAESANSSLAVTPLNVTLQYGC